MSDIVDIFRWGMKRNIVAPIDPMPNGPILNLGAGITKTSWPQKWANRVVDLDMPEWDADKEGLVKLYAENSIAGIYGFHFLEHIESPDWFLQECQAVLQVGAPATFVVPFYRTQLAHQDLGHKHFFSEETWRTLMQNDYYDSSLGKKYQWHLYIGMNVLIGVAERNIALMTQFIKG